jgi:hypothetical protein
VELNITTFFFEEWQKILSKTAKMQGTLVQSLESVDFPQALDIGRRLINGRVCK